MEYGILKNIFPQCPSGLLTEYAPIVTNALKLYNINTANRARAFLANLGHESAQLTHFVENLNYSAVGLRRTFPKYFPTITDTVGYSNKPERIANKVYANRMGNGDPLSGDGWKHRGRGGIMITGKDGYAAANKGMRLPAGVNLLDAPDLLAAPRYAIESAAWWWESHGLNLLADKMEDPNKELFVFNCICAKINLGPATDLAKNPGLLPRINGLEDRRATYQLCKKWVK